MTQEQKMRAQMIKEDEKTDFNKTENFSMTHKKIDSLEPFLGEYLQTV